VAAPNWNVPGASLSWIVSVAVAFGPTVVPTLGTPRLRFTVR
jgi:hypothetical protein